MWLLSRDRERERAKKMKGKYVRVTCIRCPRALPEGLSGPRLPLALNIFEQRLLLSMAIMLKVQILLLHAIRVWHPGALTLGWGVWRGGGVIAHLTESPD